MEAESYVEVEAASFSLVEVQLASSCEQQVVAVHILLEEGAHGTDFEE